MPLRIARQCGPGWAPGLRGVPALTRAGLLLVVLGCGPTAAQAAGAQADPAPTERAVSPPATWAAPAFPLAVEPGKRYLVDAAGTPFLMHGDTAWSLIADLTREEVDLYLDDRRARGFNTLLVNLIEQRFSTNPPANAYGERPFLAQGSDAAAALAQWLPLGSGTSIATAFADFASPNEAYFAHADWVLRRAAEEGFLVLLTPSYAGWDGGSQGWYQAMIANGRDRLRAYGAYLGRRYRSFANIMWVHGGDYHPPDKSLARAIVEGIRAFDTRALHTAHGTPHTPVSDYWQGEPWLQVSNVYTYGPVHAAARKQHARPEGIPFFLIESAYENEHGSTEQGLRAQAYQAILSGAAGQIFGNNPIWHFNGPGLYPAPMTWRQALDSPGARSMTHLRALMAALPWWLLEPETEQAFLVGGLGPEDTRAVAARASDRSFALVYLPESREITIDLEMLAGPKVVARWYDPAGGRFLAVSGSPFPASGRRPLKPEHDRNRSGFGDWVLVLESKS